MIIITIMTVGVGNKRTSGIHTNYNIVKNNAKGPGDLRRLAVTQTTEEKNQLTLVWQILE